MAKKGLQEKGMELFIYLFLNILQLIIFGGYFLIAYIIKKIKLYNLRKETYRVKN